MASMLLSRVLLYLLCTTEENKIDESHAVIHALKTARMANTIYENELMYNPYLKEQKNTIYVSALVHDICDKKYVRGPKRDNCLNDLHSFLVEISSSSPASSYASSTSSSFANDVLTIITTSSYSHMRKHGYPTGLSPGALRAYHIMREADLFDGYDVERSIVYSLHHIAEVKQHLQSAVNNVDSFFAERVFQHNADGLFITEFSKEHSVFKDLQTAETLRQWHSMLNS